MFDQAAVNAKILLQCKYNKERKNIKVIVHDCLKHLSLHLVTPTLQEHYFMPTICIDLKLVIGILKTDREQINNKQPKFEKRY